MAVFPAPELVEPGRVEPINEGDRSLVPILSSAPDNFYHEG